MSLQRKFQKKVSTRATRRVHRVKSSQVSRGVKPRISVFRSLNHLYGQIVDDAQHSTLFSISTRSLKDFSGDKKAAAKQVGVELGKLAVQGKVKDVFFDRGKYLYHGRIAAFAQGLRERVEFLRKNRHG